MEGKNKRREGGWEKGRTVNKDVKEERQKEEGQ
jgi:hypothetical protein